AYNGRWHGVAPWGNEPPFEILIEANNRSGGADARRAYSPHCLRDMLPIESRQPPPLKKNNLLKL
uniref:hypothetical protein n=1 Tax=Litorivivens sp. TaxID=2020868 RepID=UPI003561C8BC